MILAANTQADEVAYVLKAAVIALKAAAQDGSAVAGAGLAEVERCAGYVGLVLDVEVYADREEELQAMYAELNAEEFGADDVAAHWGGSSDPYAELPAIILDPGFEGDFWEGAA